MSASSVYGELVCRNRQFSIYWRGTRRRLYVISMRPHNTPGFGFRTRVSSDADYLGSAGWVFEDREAEDALIVFQVAFMRGGEEGLTEALAEVFDQKRTSSIADGMYLAEVGAWARNGGRAGGAMVRQMEA